MPVMVAFPIAAGTMVAWLSSLGFAPPLKVVSKAVDTVKDDVKNVSFPQDYGQVSLGHNGGVLCLLCLPAYWPALTFHL